MEWKGPWKVLKPIPVTILVICKKSRMLLLIQGRCSGAASWRKRTPNCYDKRRYRAWEGVVPPSKSPEAENISASRNTCLWTQGTFKAGFKEMNRCLTSQVKVIFRKGKLESLSEQFKCKVLTEGAGARFLFQGGNSCQCGAAPERIHCR